MDQEHALTIVRADLRLEPHPFSSQDEEDPSGFEWPERTLPIAVNSEGSPAKAGAYSES